MISRIASRLVFTTRYIRYATYCSKFPQNIGIIGLGIVGSKVAKNLLESGFTISALHDNNAKAGEELPSSIPRTKTPRELAELCDVVMTALPGPPHIKDVVTGENGVLAGLRSGGIWIDHSTTDYEQTMKLAEQAAQKGIHVLEAPLTGGVALLRQGKMTVLVGGDKKIFQNCLPILKQSSKYVLYMGEMGTATIVKLISNMLAALNNVSMGEAMMLAKRGGVEMKTLFDAIRLSAGNTFVWETECPLIFNGTYDPDFTLDLHCKDLNLGDKLARKFEVPIEVFSLSEQIYNRARLRFGGDKGSSYPPKMLEEDLNEQLQVPGFEDWTYTVEHVNGSIAVVHTTKDKVGKETDD